MKALTQLVLPAAHMFKRTWSTTVDKLLEKIARAITLNENPVLKSVCTDLLRLTDPLCEVDERGDLISKQLQSNLFESIQRHIHEFCQILIKNRSAMKVFCDGLTARWDTTMKALFRGFIKTQKFNIHSQLE